MNNMTENNQAIFVIESLRAGIPTRLSTRLLPDLRRSVSEQIISDLASLDNDMPPPGRLIWGQYGQGKTHALTAIEHQALDRNFAVSRISLSREISCHNLLQLYSQLAPRIRTPNSTLEGIQHYLNRLQLDDIRAADIFNGDRYVNALPAQILEDYFYAEGEDKDKLYGDLVGVRLPASDLNRIHRSARGEPLPRCRFKVTEHAAAYFGLMADAIRLCGFDGWVILIDEVELIGRLGKLSRCKAYRNLSWLLNWQNSMTYPIYTVAAAATRLQDDLWYGKTDDDRSMMPELARERFGPEACLDIQGFFTRAIDAATLKILPARTADLEQLLNRIAELHGQAYNWPAELDSAALIRHLGAQPVRTCIRAALEYLDLAHLYGQTQLPDIQSLSETSMTEDDEQEILTALPAEE